MGLIDRILGVVFGGNRNVIKETAEVFRENAEGQAVRDFGLRDAALNQFAAEFLVERQGWFDRFMDGLNRVPRPALALGTLGLFVAAMVDPVWFASRMQGVALVPEPLWWLLGAIVSFYFGARHQTKSHHFQRSIAETVARAGQITDNIAALQALSAGAEAPAELPGPESDAAPGSPELREGANAALDDWRASR